ncbi:MAG: hypothetical protein A3K09_07105 [Nitrospinae bacterium RIFCSPLOWO2_12_FULL_47_7]|nr:MAG: hypothetical protein A3K09_07105 [Nitrospinae bacterium RIFCSPLOWO2_12_FULL_47_7]
MNQSQNQPKDGVSPKLKITVITFSLFTLVAFSTFFVVFYNKMTAPAKSEVLSMITAPSKKDTLWESKLLSLADKLKNAGLKDKAIEQYQEFLDKTSVNLATRAQVSLSIADLFIELANFREALVWLYKAEMASPDLSKNEDFNAKVDTCQHQIKILRPLPQ